MKKKKKNDNLEDYRKLLDNTIKELVKIHSMKDGKRNHIMTAIGICLVGLGGVVVSLSTSFSPNGLLDPISICVIFAGISTMFMGYIFAHKGLTGCWL